MPVPIAMLFTIGWTNSQLSKTHRWVVASTFFLFGTLLQVLATAINWKHETRLNALSLAEYFVMLPLIAICIWAALQVCNFRYTSQSTKIKNYGLLASLNSILIVATVFCSLGVGLGYSVRTHIRDLVDLTIGRDYGGSAKPTTSYLFRDSMLWLQRNSNQDDLVATNFIAGSEMMDFFTTAAFPSSNLAISAISRRRVLVEGDSWGHVGLVFPDRQSVPEWLVKRIAMSHQFGRQPNTETSEYMKRMNINWFVVNKAKQMPSTWEPFAKVAFENGEVIILKLN
jgi:hypothetical protein